MIHEKDRSMSVVDDLKNKTKLTLFGYAFLLDIIIGHIDYVMGYEVGVSVFYLAPIGLVVWFVNEKSRLAFACP